MRTFDPRTDSKNTRRALAHLLAFAASLSPLACGSDPSASPDAGVADDATVISAPDATTASCTPGTRGCSCTFGACAPGLACDTTMNGGTCTELPPPPIPDDPKCWTRCRSDLLVDGQLVRCLPDGLMEGCLPGRSCMEGSCVDPAAPTPRLCASDPECPDFQTCLAGQCYSNCELDDDCGAGRVCHLRVCRLPCQRADSPADSCPDHTFCDTSNGTNGVCMPLAEGTPKRRDVSAAFELSQDQLTLVAKGATAGFSISHDGRVAEAFHIRRSSERAYDASGAIAAQSRRGDGSPLAFLEIRVDGATHQDDDFQVIVPADCGDRCPRVEVVAPETLPSASWVAWEGSIEVYSETLGSRWVHVTAKSRPDGRWSGKIHYFGRFPEGGIEQWLHQPDLGEAASRVQNGLIRRWGAFRRGRLGGGFDELRAVLNATAEESWRWPSVQSACPQTDGACYLYGTSTPGGGASSGVITYVTSLADAPIPTGHSELDFAIHVRTSTVDDLHMEGKIDSQTALHMLGDPALRLRFTADPTDPATCVNDGISGACVAFLDQFDARITVGGRSTTTDGTCPAGFASTDFPWLVPGFLQGTTVDQVSSTRVRTECRDQRFPYPDAGRAALSASLAGASPIPDGRPRARTLRILDGAMVDGRWMVILFEERFESFLESENASGFSTFGYILLQHDGDVLGPADYLGSATANVPRTTPPTGPTCSAELLAGALPGWRGPGLPSLDDPDNARAVLDYVLSGRSTSAAPLFGSSVHYLCEDTGLIDGGPNNSHYPGAQDVRVECPLGSNVRFFAFANNQLSQADIAALACQVGYNASTGARGSCDAQLDTWAQAQLAGFVLDPPWSCTNGRRYCSENRLDLRADKTFYLPGSTEMVPLAAAIDDAFRYRIRFASRNGSTVGFAPEICATDGSDRTPYCYAPEEIEQIRERVDCLLALYPNYRTRWSAAAYADAANRLQAALSESLSAVQIISPEGGIPSLRDGFERLYAELLVMLGDEAYTQAFRSRFDLAALRGAAFQGSAFEPNGIDLTGVAGFEMASLHQAAEYYQAALDRFYAIAPVITQAIDDGDVGAPPHVVTPATVTWYLDRLIRGSTQRAHTWSAIAQRYQDMNRPDLARRVLERAFLQTHLESSILSKMMELVEARTSGATRAEVVRAIEDQTRRYRVALQEMRSAYKSISDRTTLFGYAPDYVPFPVRDDRDTRASNAFEDVYNTAREYLDAARRLEDVALQSSRDFDTDAASFQAELVRIAQSYEGRLAPICGRFTTPDGQVRPAVARYAYLDENLARLGDPCGLVGNGDIHDQIVAIEQQLLRRQALNARYEHVRAEIEDEEVRVKSQCALIQTLADFEYRQGERTVTLEQQIRGTELALSTLDKFSGYYSTALSLAKCSTPADCIASGVAVGGWTAFSTANIVSAAVLQSDINQTSRDISEIQLDTAKWRTEAQCQQLQIDSAPIVAQKVRQLAELKLEAQQIMLDIRLAQSQLEGLHLEAKRVQDEQAEAEQLAINVEAVRNDPNVRIYKNDAIINADHAFQLAIRHVYRATKVYEYYTSTSYGALDQLFLVRMVSRGDYNLERYLSDLRDSFFTFEETFRAPAARVERLSLRDHVFGIPYQDAAGNELSVEARNRLFRERLTDPRLIDVNGHLAIPFATTPEQLAPCTKNHKLDFIEISLIGGNLGDDEADVLLWQTGTGTVLSLDGESRYYRLPPALIVAQPYFGRTAVFDPAVYRRYELRERPYLNTSWSLVLNQRDDPENQDIDLGQLDDIVVYLYYTDFTDPRSCGR